MEVISSFKQRYPTADSVSSKFEPANCKFFMDDMTQERYLSKPCIRLGELEKAYGRGELAEQLVKQHIRTVYGLSGARYQPDEQMVAMTAGRFVAKYGRTCSLYDMMVFFANFGSDFRTTWSTFDYNDIIKGYKEKYEPWAATKRGWEPDKPAQPIDYSANTGIRALREYVHEKVDRLGGGERGFEAFFQQSGMCRTGMLTRDSLHKLYKDFESQGDEAF